MENEIVVVVISVLAAFMSSVATVGAAAWLVSGKMNALGGQISTLAARIDGVETRLGNLEREVHDVREEVRDVRSDIRSINEYLRRPSAEQSSAAVGGA